MIYHWKLLCSLNSSFKVSTRSLSGLNLWQEELTSEIKRKIEAHWKSKLPTAILDKEKSREKYYVLSMFPYPSGALHMGHVRVYTISDTVARFQRMNGKNVIHPIGWDAFGLPAENAAIERRVAPDEWTAENIARMKSQLVQLGCSFDWHRELATCDAEYYKWTQDLFLKLHSAGLAYQKEAMVNWDPIDQTVLADEQVDENGCSWRSGAKVEKKTLKQWFIKTTAFAKELLDGLDDSTLKDWRDIIKLQRHWIGDCDGVNFDFKLAGNDTVITVWTAKPEFVKEAKFIAVGTSNILGTKKDLQAENPFTKELIPIFVVDDIELPGCDYFLGIPGACEQSAALASNLNVSFDTCATLNEEDRADRQKAICNEAKALKVGGYWSSAKLRDWLVSRQRFWGTPIPIIHCPTCGSVPVPKQDLPVRLPKLNKLSEKGTLQLPHDWINVPCPKCKTATAKRETDTLDTFVDSSWYYLRYLDPKNSKEIFDKNKVSKSVPVDLYIGGKEHAVLHLYYARFVSHFLHSLGLVPEREPFKRLLVQGMVMGPSYRKKGTGQYVPKDEVDVVDAKKNKAVMKGSGEAVVVNWEKMSKSKHNGVDPGDMFEEYGVDTTRLLTLANVAPTSHLNWTSNTFRGIENWQRRLWLTIRDFIDHRNNPPNRVSAEEFKKHDDFMFDSRNYYVNGTTFNYCGSQQLNVAISKQTGLTNSLRKLSSPDVVANSLQFERALASQIILLAPMAPHFASELWSGFLSAPNRLNHSGEIKWDKTVLEQDWPSVDDHYNLDLSIVVNGNEVSVVKMPKTDLEQLSAADAISIALKQNAVLAETQGLTILTTQYFLNEGYQGVVSIKTNYDKTKAENDKKKKKKIKKVLSN